jgi:aryl-alcohol dehydrogenase-like predicted oxidoreductase
MRYTNIPGTSLKPAVICLGGVQFIEEREIENSFKLLNLYCELGGNFLDTANIYGKWLLDGVNSSERIIGKWLKIRKNRNRLIVATKGGHPDLTTMNQSRLTKNEIESDLNESLKALQTDYIDLYWLHRDDEKIPVAVMIDYLNELMKAGKIRYFGCSNWKPERIREALNYAQSKQINGFVGNQVMWSLAVINENAFDDPTMVIMDEAGLKLHRQTELTALAYSSQANGFFNKLANQAQLPLSSGMMRIYETEETFKRLARVKKLAGELSKSITQIVLGYLISQPFTTIPIVGCHTVEQLQDSIQAGDLVLAPKWVEYLEAGN